MRFGVIYEARFHDGRCYIGRTFNFESRKKRHLKEASKGKGYYFHRMLAKHPDEWEWSVIETDVAENLLDEREKHHIALNKSNDIAYGFNIHSGGAGTKIVRNRKPLTVEHRTAISDSLKGRVKGPLPKETREKIGAKASLHQLGKKRGPCSESRRNAVSVAMKSYWASKR